MVVLINCSACDEPIVEKGAEPDQPVEAGCPACGAAFTAPPEAQTSIYGAARTGNDSRLRRLLEAGVDPGVKDEFGMAPLHWAARWGHREIVEILLEEGAESDPVDHDNQTPLYRAVAANHPAVAATLLEAGADPNAGRKPRAYYSPLSAGDNEFWKAVPLDAIDLPMNTREEFAACRHRAARMAIADREDAPDESVTLMVRAGSKPDLSGLSENDPETLTEAERERLVEMGPYGKYLVAARPEAARQVLSGMIEKAQEKGVERFAVKGLLQNPTLDLRDIGDFLWGTWPLGEALSEPEVPVSRLRQGARHQDRQVREAVAGNVNTPPEVLRNLADDGNDSVRRAVAENGSTPTDVLKDLARDRRGYYVGSSARRRLAADPSISPDRALELAEEHPEAVLSNAALDLWILEHPGLLQDAAPEAVEALLSVEDAPEGWLRWGAQHEDDAIRQVVASNPATPNESLKQLTVSEHPKIRQLAAYQPNSPDEWIALLEKAGSTSSLRKRSAEPPSSLTEEKRERLCKAGPFGRELVAAHPETPDERLRQLAETGEKTVREAVAVNPSLPLNLMWELVTDHPTAVLANPRWKTWERMAPSLWKKVPKAGILAVLRHEEAPISWLREGAKSKAKTDLRKAAGGNPSTPPDELRHLAQDERRDVREAVATNPSTPEEQLEALGEEENLRSSVAGNPGAPVALLKRLAGSPSPAVREAVAGNPNAPEGLLNLMVRAGSNERLTHRRGSWGDPGLFSDEDSDELSPITDVEQRHLLEVGSYGRHLVAAHPGTSPPVLRRLAAEVPVAVAANPSAPAELLRQVADGAEDFEVAWELASNPSTPNELLGELGSHEEAEVRREIRPALAANPGAPAEVLSDLAEDYPQRVAANPSTAPEDLSVLADSEDNDVRRDVAESPNTPVAALKSLAEDREEAVRRAVVSNPNVTADLLRQLRNDSQASVREAVASHPSTAERGLKVLAGDQREQVRRAVAENSNTPLKVLNDLADDTDDVMVAVAGNPNGFPQLTLETGSALDNSRFTREDWRDAVLGNPALKHTECDPSEILSQASASLVSALLDPEQGTERVPPEWVRWGTQLGLAELSGNQERRGVRDEKLEFVEARENAASNPSVPTKLLYTLIGCGEHCWVLEEAIQNPKVPKTLLNLIKKAGSDNPDSSNDMGSRSPITEAERRCLLEIGPYGQKLVASHPDTPPELLRELSAFAQLENEVASNPSAPNDLLRQLADPKRGALDPEGGATGEEVAGNPGAPDDLLIEVASRAGRCSFEAVAENPDAPREALKRAIERSPYMRSKSSTSPSVTPSLLWSLTTLLEADRKQTLVAAAKHPVAPPELLRQLFDKVPGAVARNSNIPSGLLSQLRDSGHEEKLARNPSAPKDVLRRLATSARDSVREKVAANPATLPDALRLLADDNEQDVCEAVASNPTSPADVLRSLSDESWVGIHPSEPSLKVAANPHAPLDLLAELAESHTGTFLQNPGLDDPIPGDLLWAEAMDESALEPVLEHSDAPLEWLRRGTQHSSPIVRAAVAKNQGCPQSLTEQLLLDPVERVRRAAAENPHVPERLLNLVEKAGGIEKDVVERMGHRNDDCDPIRPSSLTENERYRLLEGGPWGRVLVGRNPATPPTLLKQLARHDDEKVRAVVARNPEAPTEALHALSEENEWIVRGNLLANPATPTSILERMMGDKDPDTRWCAAAHPNVSDSLRDLFVRAGSTPDLQDLRDDWEALDAGEEARLCETGPWGKLLVGRHPGASLDLLARLICTYPDWPALQNTDILDRLRKRFRNGEGTDALVIELARHGPLQIRRVIADRSRTPAEALEVLASDESLAVRTAVAGNPATPSPILEQQTRDERDRVRDTVAANPNAPHAVVKRVLRKCGRARRRALAHSDTASERVLRHLATDPDVEVHRAVADHPNAPAGVLNRIFKHEGSDRESRRLIAKHPNTPLAVLRQLANDDAWQVRMDVATNPEAPASLLAEFSTDPHVNVRWQVARRPSLPESALERLAADADPGVRWIAQTNPQTPDRAIELLRKAGSTADLQSRAGGQEDLSTGALRRLMKLGPWGRELASHYHGVIRDGKALIDPSS